jgi:hypothetical protein
MNEVLAAWTVGIGARLPHAAAKSIGRHGRGA